MSATSRMRLSLIVPLWCALSLGCAGAAKPDTSETRCEQWRAVVARNRPLFEEAVEGMSREQKVPHVMEKLRDLEINNVSMQQSFVRFHLPSHHMDGNRYLIAPTSHSGLIRDTFSSASYICDLGGIYYVEY